MIMRDYFISAALIAYAPYLHGQEWRLAKESDGVKVYTRPSSTSGVKDAKALVTIDQTDLTSALNYFVDFNSHKKWIYRVTVSKILEQSGDSVYIVYYRAAAPWPVQDRDVILRYKITRTKSMVKIESTVMPDFIAEEKNVVRIREAGSYWIIKENGNGGMDVEYFNHSNPGGALPAWIANLAATKIPLESLHAMKLFLEGKH